MRGTSRNRAVAWRDQLQALAVAGVVVVTATQAVAQERGGTAYAVAGIALPQQDGVTGDIPHQTYLAAPGGVTIGWFIGGGVFLTSTVSVEAELSSTGRMRAREPSRYGMTFNDERRDRFYAVGLRFHMPVAVRVDFEPVVGVLIARGVQWTQTEYDRGPPTLEQTVVGPTVRQDLPIRVGFTAGLDLRFGGRHAGLLASFRVQRTGGDDEIVPFYPGGFPKWTIRPGMAFRFDF